MKRLPDAMFVIDLRKEQLAVREARRLGMPVVALVDTNCDPDDAEYVIPGNDDAIRSCSLVVRVIADAIEAAGASRLVTMDIHAPQIQGFFKIPVDVLYALPYLCGAIRALGLADLVVVSPDAGYAKMARDYASRLDAGFALADKARPGHGEEVEFLDLIGDVSGRDAVIVDDFVASGGTLIEAAEALMERGARSVFAAATHALFSGNAAERLAASPIERVIVTDTVETQPVPLGPKVQVVSVAPLFAEAIRRIHARESISVLFE
jgi:ribose-phosphate pyrophosphokinase